MIMEDQTREYLIGMTVKTLNVQIKQAELRLEAFLKSGILSRYKNPKPEERLFQFITDIAMSIPQLNENK